MNKLFYGFNEIYLKCKLGGCTRDIALKRCVQVLVSMSNIITEQDTGDDPHTAF